MNLSTCGFKCMLKVLNYFKDPRCECLNSYPFYSSIFVEQYLVANLFVRIKSVQPILQTFYGTN